MSADAKNEAGNEVNVLQLSIHGVLIGYLAGFKNGRNGLRSHWARLHDDFKIDLQKF